MGGKWGGARTGRGKPGELVGLEAGPLTPTAGLKQEDLGAATQCLAAVQLLDQHLGLYFLPINPQQLPLWPPVGHQGQQGTAHRALVSVQLFPELNQLLPECLKW